MAAFPVNGYKTFCPLKIIINILPPPRRLSITKINYFLFVFSFGGGCDILRAFGAWKMKIGGNYILSRRNIARMIVALGTALMLLCSDTTAQAKDFVNPYTTQRIHLSRSTVRWSKQRAPSFPRLSTVNASRCTWRRSGTTRSMKTPRRRLGGTPRPTIASPHRRGNSPLGLG